MSHRHAQVGSHLFAENIFLVFSRPLLSCHALPKNEKQPSPKVVRSKRELDDVSRMAITGIFRPIVSFFRLILDSTAMVRFFCLRSTPAAGILAISSLLIMTCQVRASFAFSSSSGSRALLVVPTIRQAWIIHNKMDGDSLQSARTLLWHNADRQWQAPNSPASTTRTMMMATVSAHNHQQLFLGWASMVALTLQYGIMPTLQTLYVPKRLSIHHARGPRIVSKFLLSACLFWADGCAHCL